MGGYGDSGRGPCGVLPIERTFALNGSSPEGDDRLACDGGIQGIGDGFHDRLSFRSGRDERRPGLRV